MPSDKLQIELKKIREQYAESIQRSVQLQDELDKSQKKIRFLENDVQVKHRQNESSLHAELSDVKAQLVHKSQLLDKVKILLQKAALKEKYLQDQVTGQQIHIIIYLHTFYITDYTNERYDVTRGTYINLD